MRFRLFISAVALAFLIPVCAFSQAVELELIMPGEVFGPGNTFSLDLSVLNTGTALTDAQLYVALSIGADFWFYPRWLHYPPDIDWKDVSIEAGLHETWEIIPGFEWPSGAGEFNGAMFYAAVIDEGNLVSNLADFVFGWSDTTQSTPTPIPPTSTPEVPSPTPTPSGPTPTPPPVPTAFINIPAGSFTMGSPDDEICRGEDEAEHTVTLTKGFFMQQVEVTRGMWADLKSAQPDLPDDPSDTQYSPTTDHPVQYVTWHEAILFANLKSLEDGYSQCYFRDAAFTVVVNADNYMDGMIYCNFDTDGYRLPTEAEWEYACRAGTTGVFSFDEPDYSEDNCSGCIAGDLPALQQYCIYCANHNEQTGSGGSKLPNPWDLYDMHGNVWEWCWDFYGEYPTGSVTDPTGPSDGDYHVRRGGAWRLAAHTCRSASRFMITPDYRFTFQGFRLVRAEP